MNTLNAPIQCFWNRNDDGTLYSVAIDKEELTVDGSLALLDQIPDRTFGITIEKYDSESGEWSAMKELKTNRSSIGTNEYKVDWTAGWLWFNGEDNIKRIRASYHGRGFWLLSDKRIFTHLSRNADGTYNYSDLEHVISTATNYEFVGEYALGRAYTPGNQVYYKGSAYIAVDDINVGESPTPSNQKWKRLTLGYNNRGTFNADNTYHAGDVVYWKSDGNSDGLYVCLADNSKFDTDTDLSQSGFWQVLYDMSDIRDAIRNCDLVFAASDDSKATTTVGARGITVKYEGIGSVGISPTDVSVIVPGGDTHLLTNKVDKISGKSLIDKAFADNVSTNGNTTTIDSQLETYSITTRLGAEVAISGMDDSGNTVIKHKLSEKANSSDVFLKSDDVVLAKDKIIKVIKDGESTVHDGSTENIQIRGDAMFIRANDVEPYGLMLSKDGIVLDTDDNENVNIKSGEITVYKKDSTGNSVAHKLTEKANTSDVVNKVDKADGKSLIDANIADSLTYDSTNGIINSDANLLLTNANSVAAYNGTFRGDITIGQLGANKWAYRISPITGFSTCVDVTCTSGNKVHSLANKADSNDVLTKTNTAAFTPTGDYQPATKKYVDDIVIEAGGGDMLRTVYDKDKTGTVDDSKKLGGQLPSYYSKTTDIGTLADLNTINKTNIVSAVNEKWTGKVYTVEVGNNWEIHTVTSNGEEKLGSYYQEIAVEGITSVGQPFVDVVLPDDDVQAKQQLTDYQCVSRVRTENGKIILKCFEDRPSSSFTIRVLVLGNTL